MNTNNVRMNLNQYSASILIFLTDMKEMCQCQYKYVYENSWEYELQCTTQTVCWQKTAQFFTT
jgi:hypothetical protein